MWYKAIENGYILYVGVGRGEIQITHEEYIELLAIIENRPTDIEGYTYMLRADTLEWELVELPPEPEPEPTPDEALTRYANELMGENDPDLVSATESLIIKFTEE